jgi:hypothetical protein
MPIHIGFTGTRMRLLNHQETWLEQQLSILDVEIRFMYHQEPWLHHGDCVGADEVAHEMAAKLGWKIHIHPPLNESKRAFCRGASVTSRSKKYLARDRIIASSCSLLLAVPGTPYDPKRDRPGQENRSGTWYTVLYGLENGKEVRVCPLP